MAPLVKTLLPEKLLRQKLRGYLLAMWRKMLLNPDVDLSTNPRLHVLLHRNN